MSLASDLVARVRRSALTRNTLWMLVGQIARTVIQAVYFLLVAQALQPAGYGAFVAAMSMVQIAAPFAGVGASSVLVKNVARDPATLPVCWGIAAAPRPVRLVPVHARADRGPATMRVFPVRAQARSRLRYVPCADPPQPRSCP